MIVRLDYDTIIVNAIRSPFADTVQLPQHNQY